MKSLRVSAGGLPADDFGGSQSSFEGLRCMLYCVRDGQRPSDMFNQATFWGQTPSVTSGALAIHNDGSIEPIPIISLLTCGF